jgi:diguanylate cyclase (GGDEF)-like protein/PAS domain S-box-containing protein
VALTINDAHGNIISINRAFVQLIGYTADEIPTLKEWWSRAYPDPQYRQWVVEQWDKHLEMAQLTGKPFAPMEIVVRCKDNAERTFICSAAVFGNDFSGDHLVILFDITERKRMEEKVREMAFHDPLTGLPNRSLLIDRLLQTMASGKRDGTYSALMFIDLDNFKPLNDTHGHAVGDLLLIEVADRLKRCVREADTVARVGGDEFVMMLSNLNADKAESTSQATIVAEKVRMALAAPYRLLAKHHGQVENTVEHLCTASIGVALFMDADVDEVLIKADAAMYEAKDAGRNQIRFFSAMVI